MGQGYVGLPLAVRAAEAGHEVVGYDVDPDRIKTLLTGGTVTDDVPAERIAPLLDAGRYRPSIDAGDCAGFDLAMIAVPTPLADGAPDLSHVEEAASTLGPHLRPGSTVILESTSYPGTTEEVLVPLLEAASGLRAGADYHLGYSPERTDPGNPRWHLENTPKLVSGIDAASATVIEDFYAGLVETMVPVASCRTAELAKLIENTFRHVNIALVNELATAANDAGLDIWSALDAAATKPFGFLRFTPGPGVGGHCLPTDPTYLSWHTEQATGRRLRLIDLANEINNDMPAYVVRRLGSALRARDRPLAGARILLLGLAYKPNTADLREAPALRIADLLASEGAHVQAADPHVTDAPFPLVVPNPERLAAADAVLLLTNHAAFDYSEIATHARYILDCRNRLSAPHIETL
ncbi:nucleotide sugar dehydrogenase [Streptomyces sp. RK75]|uniref:nucleotide sugar dehydrogenase n=1 Tax=Streptomyces sp. RK75 TaxID=2824895 RepID=UPI001B38B31A|nr:nucleotide sugar dehydrogenase [Streptomyces sp. RK75]MBQ0866361.1 nucleotide sugar dehydrogenase [Streptomyces sp. RK75]